MLYQFLKYAVNANDDRVYYGVSHQNLVPPPGKVLVPLQPDGTPATATAPASVSGGITDVNTEADSKDRGTAAGSSSSKPRATFTNTAHCYPFADSEGDMLCEKHLTRECTSSYCPLKHGKLQPIGDNRHYPSLAVAGLELRHVLLACYCVFSPQFVWAKERYIEALFDFWAAPVKKWARHESLLRRTGKMKTREIYREVSKTRVLLLSLHYYLALMVHLEEDFAGARKIERHPLFFRKSRFKSDDNTAGDGSSSRSMPGAGRGHHHNDNDNDNDDSTFASVGSITTQDSKLDDDALSIASHSVSASVAGGGSLAGRSTRTGPSAAATHLDEDGPEMERFKPYGPYDFESTHQRIYVDVLEQ